MISFLQKWIIEKKIASSMIFFGLVLMGILSFKEIPINLLPNIEFPKLTIITTYENTSPIDIENLITRQITDNVGTINGLKNIESESREGYSFVHLQFDQNTDFFNAMMNVREKLDLIRDFLPRKAGKPIINRFDPSKSAFIEIAFFPNDLSDEKSLRQFIENDILVYLERIDGVASIQVIGGYEKEVEIKIDPLMMNSLSISPSEVENIIKYNNKNYPSGQLPVGTKDLLIRAVGEFKNLIDLENIIISNNANKGIVYLKDFAQVSEVYRKRKQIARFNNRDCVLLYLFKESGKNSIEVSDSVNKTIAIIERKFGNLINSNIVYDESDFIKESINNLLFNLVIGIILAFIALLLILRNVMSPLILLASIPFTLFSSFIFFNIFNISLNMMSLGGIALGIGMLFDSSNVVLSAIERNLELGKNLNDSIIIGSNEVVKSISSAAFTTVIVFIPLIFLKNIIGLLFSEMALAIVITILLSLLNSLFVIPLLTSIFYKKRKFLLIHKSIQNKNSSSFNFVFKAQITIARNLSFFLSLLVTSFVFSILLSIFISKEFIPKIDSGEITIETEFPQGTSIDTVSEYIENIEHSLLNQVYVKKVISNIGGDERSLLNNPKANVKVNKASIKLILTDDFHRKTEEKITYLKKQLSNIEDVKIEILTKSDLFSDIIDTGSNRIEYIIAGEDIDILKTIGEEIINKLVKLKQIKSVNSSLSEVNKEYILNFDYNKISRNGITITMLSEFIKFSLDGIIISNMKIMDKTTDIRLKINNQYSNLKNLLSLRIKSLSNNNIPLSEVINIKETNEVVSIFKKGSSKVNKIDIGLDSDKSILNLVNNIFTNYTLPQGYIINRSGQTEAIIDSFKEISYVFMLSSLFIFMFLSGLFESFKISIIMIISIPLIFIGVFPCLLIFNKSLNVSSIMGLVLLAGIVVDSSSLFYEYYENFRMNNFDPEISMREATRTISRPLMMNSLTTIFGMLPIVFELGRGSEFQSPLALVVISGLISANILTIFFIPPLLLKFDKS